MAPKQFIALLAALAGIIVMGYVSSGESELGNPILGLFGALLCVLGWGSEASSALGVCATMRRQRDGASDPRDHVGARVRDRRIAAIRCLGFHGRSCSQSRDGRGRAGCFGGTVSYLFYYKSISSPIGAAKSMALNISYSAWAVLFALVLQGTMPTPISIVCCVVILAGTVLAASDWNELFGREKAKA